MEQDFLNGICSPKKIERDSAVEKLKEQMKAAEGTEKDACIASVLTSVLKKLEQEKVENSDSIQGCLAAVASAIVVSNDTTVLDEFYSSILSLSLKFLKHDESRVRFNAAEAIGALARIWKVKVYKECKETLMDLIAENISRKTPSTDSMMENKLIQKLLSSNQDKAPEQIYHDTAGWHALESSLKCLHLLVDSCADEFAPLLTQELLDLVFQTLTHTNRFVRETGYFLLGSIVQHGNKSEDSVLGKEWLHVAGKLKNGLGDNWSQVRMAASVATRKFIAALDSSPDKESAMRVLIPPMCLNRYYLAEGVRLYSQQSWAQICHGDGIAMVSTYVDAIVPYYISQSEADNHAVREAACHAIAELAVKIEQSKLEKHVGELIKALLKCFEDESWPVRDAACLATARFLSVFVEIGKQEDMSGKILPLFWSQLEDCIPSVRQGGAEGLASLATAYKEDVVEWIIPRLTEGLTKIKEQPVDSEESQGPAFPGLSSGPAVFGVAKQIRANDPDLHTGQEMYSCGSLAPKMGRGGGGCSNHSFRRPSVPWEVSEGCVQLIGELSAIQVLGATLSSLLPKVIEASKCRQFLNHVKFLETLCRRLPQMGKNLGKRHFKPHLQDFLEPMFYALSCGCELTQVAAEDCFRDMAKLFGPSIIRGRIQMMDNPEDFLRAYDRIVPPYN